MANMKIRPVTTPDYRDLAEKKLPGFLFDYISGGANEEHTLGTNVSDFQSIKLRQRVMVDVSNVDTGTTFFGTRTAMPLALAPVGMAGMMARRGEVQGAKAADRIGVPFTLSTVGICPVEEVQAASDQNIWFQLYMLKDRDVILQLLERAQQAGCETLVFTVDLAAVGLRHQDYRNGMLASGAAGALAKIWQVATRPGWVRNVALGGKPLVFGNLSDVVPNPDDINAYKAFIDSQIDASVTWKDIEWLRSVWKGNIVIKGIMEPEDAQAAADIGVEGIIVSNHGGRQLDDVASSISKLPAIVDQVGDQLDVFMDGGIRNGLDVLKAVALGAKGVLIGRPWIWAAAAGGEEGLVDLLSTFKHEMEVGLALMGVNSLDELSRDHLDL